MNILIIDTETTNGLEQPLPYDIGYQIVDTISKDVLIERSFVVAEIFLDKELMKEAYFADKIPTYWEEIKKKKRTLASIQTIRRIILKDLKTYSVSRIGAYNMGFDRRSVNNDARYITKSYIRWFFPYNVEYFCIWNMACSSILKTEDFISFALENGFVSEKENILTNAEVVYKYITKDLNFSEEHTGLEDVKIEAKIYLTVIESGLEFEDSVNSACWRKVQRKRKEIELNQLFGGIED